MPGVPVLEIRYTCRRRSSSAAALLLLTVPTGTPRRRVLPPARLVDDLCTVFPRQDASEGSPFMTIARGPRSKPVQLLPFSLPWARLALPFAVGSVLLLGASGCSSSPTRVVAGTGGSSGTG